VGDPFLKNVNRAVTSVKMRPGIIGINVKIVPPNVRFPDQVEIRTPVTEETPIPAESVSVSSTPEGEA
jgi:small subunit ribosomal protein S3